MSDWTRMMFSKATKTKVSHPVDILGSSLSGPTPITFTFSPPTELAHSPTCARIGKTSNYTCSSLFVFFFQPNPEAASLPVVIVLLLD